VNCFAAATIQVEAGQSLTDTGPYAVVRHPMYSGGLLFLFGTPLALGSAWGLLISALLLPALIVRLGMKNACFVRNCRAMRSTAPAPAPGSFPASGSA
jgi:hypothetical protein